MRLAAGLLSTATLVGAGFPAAAQQAKAPFSARQCDDAKSVIIGLLSKYQGRISADMARSFGAFTQSNCDLNTNFVRNNAADEQAFGELRVRLVALRTGTNGGVAPK